MYYVYFDNAPIIDATSVKQCSTTEYFDALAVFAALCMKFLVVELYDEDGAKLKAYSNI